MIDFFFRKKLFSSKSLQIYYSQRFFPPREFLRRSRKNLREGFSDHKLDIWGHRGSRGVGHLTRARPSHCPASFHVRSPWRRKVIESHLTARATSIDIHTREICPCCITISMRSTQGIARAPSHTRNANWARHYIKLTIRALVPFVVGPTRARKWSIY